MPTQKYLCMYRGAPSQNKPSPAQMQEMFAAFNEWKEKFKANIFDMGSKLKPSGKVVTASGVTDGPFAEAKEIVGGFMIMTGLFASWAAFICSGEMAVAFFMMQYPISLLPIIAKPGILGESAAFNCFFFLYVAATGSGPLSLDSLLFQRARR